MTVTKNKSGHLSISEFFRSKMKKNLSETVRELLELYVSDSSFKDSILELQKLHRCKPVTIRLNNRQKIALTKLNSEGVNLGELVRLSYDLKGEL